MREILIITNNPLVERCMGGRFQVRLMEELSLRELLVHVRDLVYLGHELLTHPLSGSVKPNETPYKSIALTAQPGKFSPEQAEIIANSIITHDKLAPKRESLDKRDDFQLIDYTLIAGGLDFDAAAGLVK